MSDFQQIFTFFYALYFAVNITSTGKLQPFDTASVFERKWRAILRFLVSTVVLNILPLFYFFFVYNQLKEFDSSKLTFSILLLLFFLSLAGFGFYRIFYGLMLIKIGGKYFFYDSELYTDIEGDLSRGIPKSLKVDLDSRPLIHRSWKPHLFPGLIWVVTSFLVAWLCL